jgi:hypothetical protein
MRAVVAFGRFWYDFVVGDDWTIALAVVTAVAATAVAATTTSAAWIVLPLTVAGVLGTSIARAASRATRSRRGPDANPEGAGTSRHRVIRPPRPRHGRDTLRP